MILGSSMISGTSISSGKLSAVLARLQSITANVAERISETITVKRNLSARLPIVETERVVGTLMRNRGIILAINVTETISAIIRRNRTVIAHVAETQGIHIAISRLRAAIVHVISESEVLNFAIQIDRNIGDVINVLVTWSEFETVGATQRLTDKSATLQLRIKDYDTLVLPDWML